MGVHAFVVAYRLGDAHVLQMARYRGGGEGEMSADFVRTAVICAGILTTIGSIAYVAGVIEGGPLLFPWPIFAGLMVMQAVIGGPLMAVLWRWIIRGPSI